MSKQRETDKPDFLRVELKETDKGYIPWIHIGHQSFELTEKTEDTKEESKISALWYFEQIKKAIDNYADHVHLSRINEVTEEDIEKYKNEQPYYGTCTHEYLEGIEQGAKWLLNLLKNK